MEPSAQPLDYLASELIFAPPGDVVYQNFPPVEEAVYQEFSPIEFHNEPIMPARRPEPRRLRLKEKTSRSRPRRHIDLPRTPMKIKAIFEELHIEPVSVNDVVKKNDIKNKEDRTE